MTEPGVLLITANLGTLFEKTEDLLEVWMSKLYETIDKFHPAFIALHCQEVGGKQFRTCMHQVTRFVSHLVSSPSLGEYDRAAMYLDEDFSLETNFTALGNIYFVHKSVTNVQCFDFTECKYKTLTGRNIHHGNLLSVTTHIKERFPPRYFPECRWSRKGFLRTRWRVENITFDLINVHLFHDASNVQAMEKSPSLFSTRRRQALEAILEKCTKDKLESAPLFVFGDFNFRLDAHSLINTLVGKAKPKYTRQDSVITRVVYTENSGENKVILSLEAKKFEPLDEEKFSCDDALWLLKYDYEVSSFKKNLYEYQKLFPPSYPYSEAVENGNQYMKTRVPAWCDRILLSNSTRSIISEDTTKPPTYDVIGKDVCMGDHKPVFLHFHLKVSESNKQSSSNHNSVGSATTTITTSRTPNPIRDIVTSNTNENKRLIIYRETSV